MGPLLSNQYAIVRRSEMDNIRISTVTRTELRSKTCELYNQPYPSNNVTIKMILIYSDHSDVRLYAVHTAIIYVLITT